jgi:hypothetical protein
LAERVPHPIGDNPAKGIGRASRRKRHHNSDRSHRKSLGLELDLSFDPRYSRRDRSGGCCCKQFQECTPARCHGTVLQALRVRGGGTAASTGKIDSELSAPKALWLPFAYIRTAANFRGSPRSKIHQRFLCVS